MDGPDDPLAQAYHPPASPAGPSATPPEPSVPDFRLIRLHLVVLAIAMVSLVAVTAGMQLELWDPGPTLTAPLYNSIFTIHGAAMFTLLLPLLLGVLPLLVLPGSKLRFPTWIAWPALVMWGASVVPWWAGTDPFVDPTRWLVVTAVVSSAACLYAIGLVLAVIGGGWAAFRGAPVIGVGLVLGCVGVVLFIVLSYLQQLRGPIGLAVPDLPDAMLFVLMALAVLLVEQVRGVKVSTLRFNVAFAAVLVGACWSYAAHAVLHPGSEAEIGPEISSLLLTPALLYALLRIGRPAIASLPDPAGVAVLLALVSLAGVGITWRFLRSLSADVHLHDTYFVLVPMHLAGAAALLLFVAACLYWSPALFRREPRRWPALAGVLGLGGGMLGSSVAMAMLGQQGMPRRYFVYVPQFQSLHQWIGLGGLVAVVGLAVVCIAIATGRRTNALTAPPP